MACYLDGTEKTVGFPSARVVGVSVSKPLEVPFEGGKKLGVDFSGRFHEIFRLPGFGDYRIRSFVLTDNSRAFGVSGVVEYVEIENVVKIEMKGFSAVATFEGSEILIVDVDFEGFEGVDPSDVDMGETAVEPQASAETHMILKNPGLEFAVPLEDVEGIIEWREVNTFSLGKVGGFAFHAGRVIPISKPRGNPRWVIVVKGFGIPCEGFETVGGEVEKGKKEFLLVNGKRYEVFKAGGEPAWS